MVLPQAMNIYLAVNHPILECMLKKTDNNPTTNRLGKCPCCCQFARLLKIASPDLLGADCGYEPATQKLLNEELVVDRSTPSSL